MLGFSQRLLQLSQGLLKNIFDNNLFFILSVVSGAILIYFLFRNVRIDKREPIS